mmetsp:Transcript_52236/g.91809  ORF Transcript_52236/g.91809 Transcript_52236/m.91809 type:complete len:135 (+) Transcript_52236:38-442(+)
MAGDVAESSLAIAVLTDVAGVAISTSRFDELKVVTVGAASCTPAATAVAVPVGGETAALMPRQVLLKSSSASPPATVTPEMLAPVTFPPELSGADGEKAPPNAPLNVGRACVTFMAVPGASRAPEGDRHRVPDT